MLVELADIKASPAEVALACDWLRGELPKIQATITQRVLALRAATQLCDRIAATLAIAPLPAREEILVASKEPAPLPDSLRLLREARAILARISK